MLLSDDILTKNSCVKIDRTNYPVLGYFSTDPLLCYFNPIYRVTSLTQLLGYEISNLLGYLCQYVFFIIVIFVAYLNLFYITKVMCQNIY